jgi:hypothetical protein
VNGQTIGVSLYYSSSFLNLSLTKQVTALLGGLIYYQTSTLDDNGTCSFDQGSVQIVSFAVFYSITVSVIFSMLNAVMVFPLEIPIYFREHSASVYRSDTYYLSKLINEVNEQKINKS